MQYSIGRELSKHLIRELYRGILVGMIYKCCNSKTINHYILHLSTVPESEDKREDSAFFALYNAILILITTH